MTGNQDDSYIREIQERTEGDLLKAMIEVVAHRVMEEEVTAHLGVGRYERDEKRKGHRNGYKPRKLKTRLGELNLQVPQVRGDAEPYNPMFFNKWERTERALLVTCAEMYYMGVSTRKVNDVIDKMGAMSISAATVSRVATEIDEKISEFRNRRLDHTEWPFLMVDATYVKVRRGGRVVDSAALIVVGITSEGQREILTWRMAESESEDSWRELFSDLKKRGVRGVQWVVSDGHAGIRAAVREEFTGASWQRCWVHFMRGVLGKVGQKNASSLGADLRAARKFEDVAVCLDEAERIASRIESKYPKAASAIREQFEETLAMHAIAPTSRRRVYTTNMIERLNAEIKRRTRVVGIFPNDASADRLIGAHLLERHEKWLCSRSRYIVLDVEN